MARWRSARAVGGERWLVWVEGFGGSLAWPLVVGPPLGVSRGSGHGVSRPRWVARLRRRVSAGTASSAQIVLPKAIDYAKCTGARLHVLSVIPDGMIRMTIVAQLIPDNYEQKLVEDAKLRLKSLVAEQTKHDVDVEEVVRACRVEC